MKPNQRNKASTWCAQAPTRESQTNPGPSNDLTHLNDQLGMTERSLRFSVRYAFQCIRIWYDLS